MKPRRRDPDPDAARLEDAVALRWRAATAAALGVVDRAEDQLAAAQAIEAGFDLPAVIESYAAEEREPLLWARSPDELAKARGEVWERAIARRRAARGAAGGR